MCIRDSSNNVPIAIECTFSCEKTGDQLAMNFPNQLDMPNNRMINEYSINFSDDSNL